MKASCPVYMPRPVHNKTQTTIPIIQVDMQVR